MKKIAFLGLLFLLSINASMAGSFSGKVHSIVIAEQFDNKIYVRVEGKFDKQGCSTNKIYPFAFDGTTHTGRNFLMMLTSAIANGTEVYMEGDGKCEVSGTKTVETLTGLHLLAQR